MDTDYINHCQELFTSDDTLANDDRKHCLSRISALQSLLRYKVEAITDFDELDSQTMMYYSDIKSIVEYIDNLYNTVIRMDNLRIESIKHLVSVFKEMEIELQDGVRDYDA